MKLEKNDIGFVQLINAAGFDVVVMCDRFFAVETFIPASTRDQFHSLDGLDVTDIRNHLVATTHDLVLDIRLKSVTEQINSKSIPVKADFSHLHEFVWFKHS